MPTLFVWGLIINYQVAIVERGEEQHTIENMHVVNERVNNNAFSILTVSSCTVGCRRRSCTFRYTLGSWECCEGGEVAKKCAWYLDCRHTYIDREGMFGEVSNILWGVLVLLYNQRRVSCLHSLRTTCNNHVLKDKIWLDIYCNWGPARG